MVQYLHIHVNDAENNSFYVTLLLSEHNNKYQIDKGSSRGGIYVEWNPKSDETPYISSNFISNADALSTTLELLLKSFVNGNKRFPKEYKRKDYVLGCAPNTFELDYKLVERKNVQHICGLVSHMPDDTKDILRLLVYLGVLEEKCIAFMNRDKSLHYFDSHCHPDHPLVTNPHSYVKEALETGVEYLLVAPITHNSNFSSMDLFPKDLFPNVLFAKGLHPRYASKGTFWSEKEMEKFRVLLKSDERIVALKTGIDLSNKNLYEDQIKQQFIFMGFFHHLAFEYKMPLILHIRDAERETLEYLSYNPLLVPAEIHCFTYGKEVMNAFIEAGVHYFGIGGMLTRPENEALREAVKEMPLEMILLESDSPFVKVFGDTEKINTSAKAIPAVAKAVAELKGISVSQVVEQCYQNCLDFFQIKR